MIKIYTCLDSSKQSQNVDKKGVNQHSFNRKLISRNTTLPQS